MTIITLMVNFQPPLPYPPSLAGIATLGVDTDDSKTTEAPKNSG